MRSPRARGNRTRRPSACARALRARRLRGLRLRPAPARRLAPRPSAPPKGGAPPTSRRSAPALRRYPPRGKVATGLPCRVARTSSDRGLSASGFGHPFGRAARAAPLQVYRPCQGLRPATTALSRDRALSAGLASSPGRAPASARLGGGARRARAASFTLTRVLSPPGSSAPEHGFLPTAVGALSVAARALDPRASSVGVPSSFRAPPAFGLRRTPSPPAPLRWGAARPRLRRGFARP